MGCGTIRLSYPRAPLLQRGATGESQWVRQENREAIPTRVAATRQRSARPQRAPLARRGYTTSRGTFATPGSIPVLLPQALAEAQHPLDALHLVDPVLQRRRHLVGRRGDQ